MNIKTLFDKLELIIKISNENNSYSEDAVKLLKLDTTTHNIDKIEKFITSYHRDR